MGIQPMKQPTINTSTSGSASLSNGSEEQGYGDFFSNFGHSSSSLQPLPTHGSSSSDLAEHQIPNPSVSGHYFSRFGTSTEEHLSPLAIPSDSKENDQYAGNSPKYGAASRSSASRFTHFPSPSLSKPFGTQPQSPSSSRLNCSSPTTFGSPTQTQAKTSDHFGKTADLNKTTNTWVKSYLDSIQDKPLIPGAIKEIYREHRELQKLADFYSRHNVKVLTAGLNANLAFVQENLPEQLSIEEQKVAIKSLFMKLPELWADGYFIIPDIKSDNIRAKIEEDGTKQAYLFDTHFTQEGYWRRCA